MTTTEPNLSPAHHEVQAALHLQAIDHAAAKIGLQHLAFEAREEYAIRANMAQAHATLALSLRVAEVQGPSAVQVVGVVTSG